MIFDRLFSHQEPDSHVLQQVLSVPKRDKPVIKNISDIYEAL